MAERVWAPVARSENCSALFYQDGKVRDDAPLDDIDQALRRPGCLVWLDVERPTEENLTLVAREFDLHPLAIEDIRKGFQRPKLDQYGDSRLIVMFDAQLKPGAKRDRVDLGEVDIFIGPNYLITVHERPVAAIAELRDRWREHPDIVENNPLGFLLYHLLDTMVDAYFPVVEALETEIEDVEERLYDDPDRLVLREISSLRRDVVQIRRVLGPQWEAINLLIRREDELIDRATVPYFTDVVDLLLRLTNTVDSMRELLGVALESHLSLQSYALNGVMKRLTALTVILFTPTIISGIYGMNFTLMPSQDWPHAFWFTIGLMVASVFGTAAIFRRNGWL